MVRNDGTIISKGKGVWEVQVSLGKSEQTGRYERVTRTVHGAKKDAVRVKNELLAQREKNVKAEGAKMLFCELAREWKLLREQDESLSTSAKRLDTAVVEHLIKQFRGKRVDAITPSGLERLYSGLRSGAISKSGKSLKGNTVIKYHQRMNMIMQRAVNHDLIDRNPCDRAKSPSCVAEEKRALTIEEGVELIDAANRSLEKAYQRYLEKEERWRSAESRSNLEMLVDIPRSIAILLAFGSGMRRSEILTLRWEDVSLEYGEIHVRHSLDCCAKLKAPKTKSSIRTIAIGSDLVETLALWKRFQFSKQPKMSIQLAEAETPGICSALGGFTHPANFST